jgi:electron transport complex protein RnfG
LVLPEFNNDPTTEIIKEGELEIYPAKKDNVLVGYAVKTYTDKGFSGRFWLMVGFKMDGSLKDVSVLEQNETPGLGTKMKEPKFKNQFLGKIPGIFKLSVKKDGGDVDAITAATISSRAFCDAVQRGYDTIKDKFSKGETVKEGGLNE